MSFQPKNHITDYLDGLLKGSEKRAFEEALADDVQLREALDLQQRIETDIRSSKEEEGILKIIAKAEAAYPYQAKKVRLLPTVLSVAAAVILLVVAGWYFLLPNRLPATELAMQYAQLNVPESVLPMVYGQMRNDLSAPSVHTSASNIIDSARRVLYTRDYPTALVLYQQLPDAQLTDSLRFERALLYLQTNAPQDALSDLESISSSFEGGVHWYKALSFLYLGNTDAARTQVQRLVSKYDRPYRKDALELLDDLQ